VAYHDELLQQARELVDKDQANPTQADLRRSVSSACFEEHAQIVAAESRLDG